MIFIILLIYFILLILIEFSSILSTGRPRKNVNIENIDNIDQLDINIHKLKYETSDLDINLKNYVGKFLIKNTYGFYINLNTWNLIEKNKLYEFLVPVNIIIIKIRYDENIEYLIN